MISIWENGPVGQLPVTDNEANLLGANLVIFPQRNAHLLEEVVDLQGLEGGPHKLVDLGQDVLLPIIQELILLDLRGLQLEQVRRFAVHMRLWLLLCRLV